MLKEAELIELPLSFVMTPVIRGKLSYEALTDGTVDLADLWLLNVSIAVADENERRIMQALKERNSP